MLDSEARLGCFEVVFGAVPAALDLGSRAAMR
jgi:hypothetical protein